MRLHLHCLDTPDEHYQPQWLTIRDQSFEGKMIPVDNHQYGNCVFLDCHFLYSGGPFGFHECTVDGSALVSLNGPARNGAVFQLAFEEYIRLRTPIF
jgi:hypothetical protein